MLLSVSLIQKSITISEMSRELQGSYNPVFYTLTLMPFLTGLLSLFLLVSTNQGCR